MANNTVNPYNSPNTIIITDSDQNQITVTQPVTTLLEVGAVGPQGQKGDKGDPGVLSPSQSGSFEITGSLLVSGSTILDTVSATGSFTGSFTGDGSQLTGIVSSKWTGSNPISRESDVEVTGSFRVTGGISGSFSGSGANLFNIPASGIVGLNLSQIATGTVTASVATGTQTFSVISGGNSLMTLDSSGRIGLGTTSPLRNIDVVSSAGTSVGLKLNSTSTGGRSYSFFSTNNLSGIGGGKFGIYDDTAQASRITLDSTGNVGIGTISPSYKLDVVGSGNFSNDLTVTGSLIASNLTASSATISGNVIVQGTASINTLVVNQTQYTSGSNQLGDGIEDTQTLFGTVRIPTGSLTVTGSTFITGSLNVTGGITGSLFGTASLALTASYIDGGFY